MAAGMELEKGLTHLLEDLEEAGIADHTLIAMAPDHVPYSDLDILEELAGRDFGSDSVETLDEENVDLDVYRNTWILWSAGMKEPVEVEKICSQVDILPTMLNLLGAEYDSRLLAGTDVFSDQEGMAIFFSRSWITEQQIHGGVPTCPGRGDDRGRAECVCGKQEVCGGLPAAAGRADH